MSLKPLVLFDLNGTLIFRDHTNNNVKIRPGIQYLYLLKMYYELGVYTSMTLKNTKNIMQLIHEKFVGLFGNDCLVLTRDHCELISHPRPWSSVKPIKKYFPTRDVIIIEDTISKALPDELQYFWRIPSWDGRTVSEYELLTIVRGLLDTKIQM